MDILAGIFELIGIYLIGNKNRWGFIFAIVGGLIWISVGLDKDLNGLIGVVVLAPFLNFRNFRRWNVSDK